MGFDGIYRLTDPPMSGDQVRVLQDKARRGFGSYAIPLGVVVNGVYDRATRDFVAEYQRRKQESGYLPVLPANKTAVRGDLDYETKKALGMIAPTPAPAAKYVGYAIPGTWGVWNIGPQCMAVNRDPEKVFLQGVGYNTSAFLNPDPNHSYIEAVAEGVGETLRLALPDFRPKFVSGYSMGAEVVARFLAAWPQDRRDEIKGVFTFGSPSRPPGPTLLGHDYGGAGISGFYTPEWARDREYSYDISGDMYPDATGFLPAFYQLATRMEATPEFAMYLFCWLTGIPLGGFGSSGLGGMFGDVAAPPSPIGSGLLGLGGSSGMAGFGALSGLMGLIGLGGGSGQVSLPSMIFNLPQIIITLIAALKFLFTNAHGKYWVDPIFEGMTAEDHAAATVRRLAV